MLLRVRIMFEQWQIRLKTIYQQTEVSSYTKTIATEYKFAHLLLVQFILLFMAKPPPMLQNQLAKLQTSIRQHKTALKGWWEDLQGRDFWTRFIMLLLRRTLQILTTRNRESNSQKGMRRRCQNMVLQTTSKVRKWQAKGKWVEGRTLNSRWSN